MKFQAKWKIDPSIEMSKTFTLWIIHDPHINGTPDSLAVISMLPWHDACLYCSSEHLHYEFQSPSLTRNLKTFYLVIMT